MVMKDKIVKNHRTGYYYKAKQIGLVVSGIFVALAVIIIPTYISLNYKPIDNVSKAEEEVVEEADTPLTEEGELQTY